VATTSLLELAGVDISSFGSNLACLNESLRELADLGARAVEALAAIAREA
jgi:hypothetical protein